MAVLKKDPMSVTLALRYPALSVLLLSLSCCFALAFIQSLYPHGANLQLGGVGDWVVAGAGEDIDRHVVKAKAGEDRAAR